MLVEVFICIELYPILWVHHTQIVHDIMNKESPLQFYNQAINNTYNTYNPNNHHINAN
jgi:hypothetical protein